MKIILTYSILLLLHICDLSASSRAVSVSETEKVETMARKTLAHTIDSLRKVTQDRQDYFQFLDRTQRTRGEQGLRDLNFTQSAIEQFRTNPDFFHNSIKREETNFTVFSVLAQFLNPTDRTPPSIENVLERILEERAGYLNHRFTLKRRGNFLPNTNPAKLHELSEFNSWIALNATENYNFFNESILILLSATNFDKLSSRAQSFLHMAYGIHHLLNEKAPKDPQNPLGYPDDGFCQSECVFYGVKHSFKATEPESGSWSAKRIEKQNSLSVVGVLLLHSYDSYISQIEAASETLKKEFFSTLRITCSLGPVSAINDNYCYIKSYANNGFSKPNFSTLKKYLQETYEEYTNIETGHKLLESFDLEQKQVSAELGAFPQILMQENSENTEDALSVAPPLTKSLSVNDDDHEEIPDESLVALAEATHDETLPSTQISQPQKTRALTSSLVKKLTNSRYQRIVETLFDSTTTHFAYADMVRIIENIGGRVELNGSSHGKILYGGKKFPTYRPHPQPVFGKHGIQDIRAIFMDINAMLASEE